MRYLQLRQQALESDEIRPFLHTFIKRKKKYLNYFWVRFLGQLQVVLEMAARDFDFIPSHLNTTFHRMDSIFGKLYIDKYFWKYIIINLVDAFIWNRKKAPWRVILRKTGSQWYNTLASFPRIWLIRVLSFMNTAISRKVVGKKCARDNPER